MALSKYVNNKSAHIALVVVALVVVLLRNHGVLSAADVDAIVAGLGSFGVGLNINLSDKQAVEAAIEEATSGQDGALTTATK